jgi:sugar lactone lactonase YvrE
MKNKVIIFIVVQIITLLISTSALRAWTGDTWGQINRETILRIADEMIDFSWTPKNTINNQTSNDYPIITYFAGTVYKGEAYSLYNTQHWTEFYSAANSTSGGTTSYGNDCSGFASISWKLPERYNTTAFECDAINGASSCGNYNPSTDDYVTKLGDTGSGPKVGLLLGDAFVKSGSHIILFESYRADGKGIIALEQSTYPNTRAVRTDRYTWDALASYRPIRRNKIDEGNYVFKTKWGTQGNGNGQFNYPEGLAIDSSGNVYVVDSGNKRIQKFNSNGVLITKWGAAATSFDSCYGDGRGCYICEQGKFTTPTGITVDSSGNVYITDTLCGIANIYGAMDDERSYIQKFASNGSFISWWVGGFGFDYYLSGIASDFTGNVYVANNSWNSTPVLKFTNGGSFITKWGYQDSYPADIAVDLSGNVYIAGSNNRIQKFDSNGNFKTEWGSCCLCDTCPGIYFHSPGGVAIDSSGNIYVADSGNNRIQKFDSNGNFITKWGSYSYWEDGKFQWPKDVSVDSSLNVYVSDTDNNRIQKFAPVPKLPTGPSNLTATAVSSSQINLSWQDNSTNEKGFKIKRKNGLNGTYTAIATVGANVTNFADTGIVDGGTRYYAVWAYNDNGESAYSDEVPSCVIGCNPPAAPSNLTTQIGSDPICLGGFEIKLNWFDNSNNESGFKIEEKMCQPTCGSFTSRWTVGPNTKTANVRCLSKTIKGYFYYYRIKAYNQYGQSAYSNEAMIKY